MGTVLWLLVFVLVYWLTGRAGVLVLAITVLALPVVVAVSQLLLTD